LNQIGQILQNLIVISQKSDFCYNQNNNFNKAAVI